MNPATGAYGGAPYGVTKRERGLPKKDPIHHVNPATGAFGGAPYGATKRVRGVPKLTCGGRGAACERTHWGLRWSSLWGRETREGCTEMELVSNTPAPTDAVGGTPYGATKCVRGVPK